MNKVGDIVDSNSIDYSVFGLGFEEGNKGCFKRYLLEQLKKQLPGMHISNTIPDQSDVMIINLDAQSVRVLEKKIPADDSYVIMIVHDLTRSTLPYLKLADHVVYINEVQKFVCEGFLELNYPSSVLPYPFGEELSLKEERGNCFVYMEGDGFLLAGSYYENRMNQALQWHYDEKIKHYCFVFEVNSSAKGRFQEFKAKMSAMDARFRIYDAKEMAIEEIYALISQSFCGQLFKNEITLEQYLDALENSQSAILHDVLSESPILSAMRAMNIESGPSLEKTFYNYNFKKKGSWRDWYNLMDQLLKEVGQVSMAKAKAISAIEVDALPDLNIIYGKPLVNDYVFSICFRNQKEKIIRCLDSIKNQAGNHDFGIAIVSDKSSDGSIKKILDYVQNCGIDVCLVDNQERKYASRNFYNVVHSLVLNDESIIMEVDGDDFLAGNDVLTILDSYYKKGALKTNGSYKMYPEDQIFASVKGIDFNHQNYDVSNPWSLRCTSWLHLRTAKRFLLRQVELKYFLERQSKKWLMDRHDSAVQPRVIELAGEKALFVKEILYNYDVSGDNHDHSGDSIDKLIIEDYKKTDKLYYPLSLSYM